MTTNRLIVKLRNTWGEFARAKDGNTAVVFALTFIPLMGLTGAAVDYSLASMIRTSMQASGDATALALAQNVATNPSLTAGNITSEGSDYFNAVFTHQNQLQKGSLQVTTTFTNVGSTVLVTATGTYNTNIMGILGIKQVPLKITSTANFGTSRLRVALVLDNTGSMAQNNKLVALKNATTDSTSGLLTQLKNAATTNGDVYVSIIPFVKDVNLDSVNYTANWIYWDDAAHTDNKSWDALNGTCSVSGNNNRSACLAASGGTCSISGHTSQNSCTSAGTCSLAGYTTQSACLAATGSCSISGNTTQSACTAAGSCNNTNDNTQSSCIADGYCSISSHHRQSSCTSNGGTWMTPAIWSSGVWTAATGVWTAGVWSPPSWTPANHNTWNGCVMDRGDPAGPNAGNYDTNVAAPDPTTPASLFPAEQYSACPQAVMGLSYNWSAMTTEVTNMVANGNTNQSIGLELGWMSLVGGGPFTAPPMDPGYTYQQVIILLTDGLNTQNRWWSNSNMCGSVMCIDSREAVACTNIKNAGITIYTIQVNTSSPPDPTSTLLQNCASDPSKFFLLTSSTEIVTAFNQIGTQLSQLRIAK